MSAGVYKVTIEQGATFALVLTWKDSAGAPIDLTGYTARMQIRTSARAATATLALTTENGRIALGGAAGTITLSISAVDTAALAARPYVYDLELVTGASVTRLLDGECLVTPEVTR